MPEWNFARMGQVGLTRWIREVAQPVTHIYRQGRRGAQSSTPRLTPASAVSVLPA